MKNGVRGVGFGRRIYFSEETNDVEEFVRFDKSQGVDHGPETSEPPLFVPFFSPPEFPRSQRRRRKKKIELAIVSFLPFFSLRRLGSNLAPAPLAR